MASSWLLRLIIIFQAYMDPDMSENRDSQNTPANSGNPVSSEIRTNYGNRLSRCCHQNLLNLRAAVHIWINEKQWKLFSICFALRAN